jgi:hypothetical protein
VQVVDAVEDLVEQRLDHALGHHHWLLVRFGGTVKFYYVLHKEKLFYLQK